VNTGKKKDDSLLFFQKRFSEKFLSVGEKGDLSGENLVTGAEKLDAGACFVEQMDGTGDDDPHEILDVEYLSGQNRDTFLLQQSLAELEVIFDVSELLDFDPNHEIHRARRRNRTQAANKGETLDEKGTVLCETEMDVVIVGRRCLLQNFGDYGLDQRVGSKYQGDDRG